MASVWEIDDDSADRCRHFAAAAAAVVVASRIPQNVHFVGNNNNSSSKSTDSSFSGMILLVRVLDRRVSGRKPAIQLLSTFDIYRYVASIITSSPSITIHPKILLQVTVPYNVRNEGKSVNLQSIFESHSRTWGVLENLIT